MSLNLPDGSELSVRETFRTRLCALWKMRNCKDPNARRYARQTIRAFCSIIRQLS